MYFKGLIFCCVLLGGMDYSFSQSLDLQLNLPFLHGLLFAKQYCRGVEVNESLAFLQNPQPCDSTPRRNCLESSRAVFTSSNNSCACVHCCSNNADCTPFTYKYCRKPGSLPNGKCFTQNNTCGCEMSTTTTTTPTPSTPRPQRGVEVDANVGLPLYNISNPIPTCLAEIMDFSLAILDNPQPCESKGIQNCHVDRGNTLFLNSTRSCGQNCTEESGENSLISVDLNNSCTCVHCCYDDASCETFASTFCQKPGSHAVGKCSTRNSTCGCEYTEYTTTTNTTTSTTTTSLTPSSPKPICGGHQVDETLAFEQNQIPCDSASFHSCLDISHAYHIHSNSTNSCACVKCCSNLDDCNEYKDKFCEDQVVVDSRKCFAETKTCGCRFKRTVFPISVDVEPSFW